MLPHRRYIGPAACCVAVRTARLSLLLPPLHRTHGGRRRVVHLELKVEIWFDVATCPHLVLPLWLWLDCWRQASALARFQGAVAAPRPRRTWTLLPHQLAGGRDPRRCCTAPRDSSWWLARAARAGTCGRSLLRLGREPPRRGHATRSPPRQPAAPARWWPRFQPAPVARQAEGGVETGEHGVGGGRGSKIFNRKFRGGF